MKLIKSLILSLAVLVGFSSASNARDVTLSNDADWKTYRQALRDLPSSASPKLDADGNLDMSSVTFPSEPS